MFSSKLISRLKNAFQIVGLIGPGLTNESKNGEWNKGNIPDFGQLSFASELENKKLWQMIIGTRKMIHDLRPNLGHYSLVDFEKHFDEFDLISQNIDDLQQRAGSRRIIELHGNLMLNICPKCGFKESCQDKLDKQAKCPECGSLIKPAVVFKDERIDPGVLSKAQEVAANCEVLIMIGTTGLMDPALSLPYIAKGNGAYLVEINIEETQLSTHANEFIKGESAKILPHLVTALLDS